MYRVIFICFFLFQVFSYPVHGADTLRLMSFNIRLSSADDGMDSWKFRKNLLLNYIAKTTPDILCVQEALPDQVTFLDSIRPYEYVGVGRENGLTQGEYCAIFYNSHLFELMESGTFWLSDKPAKPGLGWDAACIRICTWAKFKTRNDKIFYVFNTHLDHMGVRARLEGARLIMGRISMLPIETPVFLAGDMNAPPDSQPISVFMDFLGDSREMSQIKDRSDGMTFNGFKKDSPASARIDYIFVRPGQQVYSFQTNQDRPEQQFISDHFAVEGKFAL